MKNILTKTLALAFLCVPMFAYADTGTSTTSTTTPPVGTTTQVTCLQNALDKRENALIAAHDAYNDAVKTALLSRLEALKNSVAQTDKKIKLEKKIQAYKTFHQDMNAANNALRAAKNLAWKTYQTDTKACGLKATGEVPALILSPNNSL